MVDMYGFDGEKVSEDEWSELFHSERRFVAREEFEVDGQGIFVSTVWIGLAWMLEVEEGERPLIYETMVFYNDDSFDDVWCGRSATREDAEKTHKWIVDELVSGRMVLPKPEFSDDEVF
jgi:hypothetical protein